MFKHHAEIGGPSYLSSAMASTAHSSFMRQLSTSSENSIPPVATSSLGSSSATVSILGGGGVLPDSSNSSISSGLQDAVCCMTQVSPCLKVLYLDLEEKLEQGGMT